MSNASRRSSVKLVGEISTLIEIFQDVKRDVEQGRAPGDLQVRVEQSGIVITLNGTSEDVKKKVEQLLVRRTF